MNKRLHRGTLAVTTNYVLYTKMAAVLRFVSVTSHENVPYLAYLYMYMYNVQVHMHTAANPFPCNKILRAAFIGGELAENKQQHFEGQTILRGDKILRKYSIYDNYTF